MPQIRLPGESAEYRSARDELLRAEAALRRQTEEVARLRRSLPLGGKVKEDYVFRTMDDRAVKLSGLFRPGKDTLVMYSYIYGPAMKSPCPLCTSILDRVDAEAPHITDRVNLAVAAKSPPSRIREVASQRGWRHLQLLSSATNSYNADYHGEDAQGSQLPMLNVFVRRDGGIHHTYATELFWGPKEEGMDGRHVDSIWPLWNVFDFTPDGRGTNWYPKLGY
jgi:predicted dithiol-disulfide oxidoreductase (DUF899 family)